MPTHISVYNYWRFRGAKLKSRYTCMGCEYKHPDGFNLERAHIVARCDDGPDTVENLVLLCHDCHVWLDGLSVQDWEKRLLQ